MSPAGRAASARAALAGLACATALAALPLGWQGRSTVSSTGSSAENDAAPIAESAPRGQGAAPRALLPSLLLRGTPAAVTPLPSRPTAAPTGSATASATDGTPSPGSGSPISTPPPATTPRPTGPPPFGLVALAPDAFLTGPGVTVDSLAFWEAPDPADSLLLATAKGNGLVEVWPAPYDGAERPPLRPPRFAEGAVNGIAVDAAADELFVALARPASTVLVFSLPELRFLREIVAGEEDLRGEPNLGLLRMPDGARRLYVSADVRVFAYPAEGGDRLFGFDAAAPLESLLADEAEQVLYLPDEVGRSGVYAYDPDGRPLVPGGGPAFGGDGVFQADAEGIALYACRDADGRDTGAGWILVADQRSPASDFEVFDRASWAHLGRVQLAGVSGTDGIASTRQALPGHPGGLFAAVDADRRIALVGWDRLLEAMGLRCGADGRGADARAGAGAGVGAGEAGGARRVVSYGPSTRTETVGAAPRASRPQARRAR